MKRFLAICLAAGLLIGAAATAAFIRFATRLETEPSALLHRAEGMITLTGGADRVTDAISLFAQGHADRLLITGVNPSITRTEIARLNPKFRDLIECCVDLGYEALNTTGNAKEARNWVEARRIKSSLIIVTSNYHMPRALAEFRHALPHHRLIPYPVVTTRMRTGEWWRSSEAARIIGTEFLKYSVAVVRISALNLFQRPV